MKTTMDQVMLEGDKTLSHINSTFEIIAAHVQLIINNPLYKNKVCNFLNKKDGVCQQKAEDIIQKSKISEISKAEKKRQAEVRKELIEKIKDNGPRRSERVNQKVKTNNRLSSPKKKTNTGGSPYAQYGGTSEVEKHREDYQRNNYMRYQNIPIAYPVTRVEEIDKSISSVFVTIDLELHKGKTISNSELASSKCNHQYNAIKHSFAVLTGTPYIIAPVYGGTRRNKHFTKKQTHKKHQRLIIASRKRRRNKTRKLR
jgi:hypothetical protein